MQVLIVYESMFGNTHEIAEAVCDGVREAAPDSNVDCVRVTEASQAAIDAADLLVVGGPTHMRGMSTGTSRKLGLRSEQEAESKEHKDLAGEDTAGEGRAGEDTAAPARPHHLPEPGAEGPGVRDWFQAMPKAPKGHHAAAFDTRGDARMAGGAARGIARKLRRHGYELVAKPEGFIVEDSAGPLRQGELDRARQWGAALVGSGGPS